MASDPVAVVAGVIMALVVLTALVGPLLIGNGSNSQNLSRALISPFHPSRGWQYMLGSDSLGRSVLDRLISATRTTALVAVPTVAISAFVGSVSGMCAGYYRGWIETVLMRIADAILSFPTLLLAVAMLFVVAPSPRNIVIILSISRTPVYLRTVRSKTAELRTRLYVDAARTVGERTLLVIRRHVVPFVVPTVLTVAALDISTVILAESSLSFLGIGIQPPAVSWGSMVADGEQYLQSGWWMAFFPGLAITLTTLSATVLSSWTRTRNLDV